MSTYLDKELETNQSKTYSSVHWSVEVVYSNR